jgi:Kef-type K+ transport system membrane component KefB
MNSADFVKLALQFATMLAFALFFGQMMRRIKQPAVLGEMIGGIILGPTILGLLAPSLYNWLFQSSAEVAVVREASIKLGMLFFLFIAGLEVDLSDLKRMGKRATLIGLVGTLLPIGVGVGLVYLLPRSFWGPLAGNHLFAFALFVGMNLANSANPVIARILMDLGLLKGEIGTLIMTATIVDDLVNWTIFAIILGEISPSASQVASASGLLTTILMVVAFFIAMLGLGHWLGPLAFRWIRKRVAWPSGFIAVTFLAILISGSISEALGIHAFLGAFLLGAAVGGHDKEHTEAHEVIMHFVLSFFAPIYFVSMGMSTNFIAHFDLFLVTLILVVACVSKVGAVLLGARMAGMKIDRQVWAIGFGLNARGATGIILAGVGLANRVIDERIFVAIVVMALITSLMSGPLMTALLNRELPFKIPGGETS